MGTLDDLLEGTSGRKSQKAYKKEYMQRPEVKARYNEISKKKSKERKRKNTKKRIQEHTMEELMQIVRETCEEKNINYDDVKDKYEEFMQFLHDV